MGPGCAFYFLLVLYTIVAGVLDIFCAAVAWLIARIFKVRFKWLVVLFAALTPSLFLGSEFVLGMIASSYMSVTKGVDLGFGDCWYEITIHHKLQQELVREHIKENTRQLIGL